MRNSWVPTALLVVLAAVGGWLIVDPFTVGDQVQGAAWSLQTRNDFISGAVLLAGCLFTLAGSLIAALRARMRQAASAEVSGHTRDEGE